jgi:osmotically-inducible protein OsmY
MDIRKASAVLTLVLCLTACLSACSSVPSEHAEVPYVRAEVIAAEVRVKLQEYYLTSVHVKAYSDKVQLSGVVDTPAQKQLAGKIASQVNGANVVYNDIQVKQRSTD